MAAITINTTDAGRAVRFLESVTVTNQPSTAATKKAIKVPEWANRCIFYIFLDSMGGTSPLFDFVVGQPDFGDAATFSTPTDANDIAAALGTNNAAWNGITQFTGTSAAVITVEIAPDVTDDDTGSATASCYYAVRAVLPPWLTYTYTLDGTSADEDYAFRIVAHFKP